MQLFSDNGYQGVPIGRIVSAIKHHGKQLRRIIGLTFDDGFKDFLPNALSVLLKHGFSGTLFVVPGEIGKVSHWSSCRKDRPLLNWDDLH